MPAALRSEKAQKKPTGPPRLGGHGIPCNMERPHGQLVPVHWSDRTAPASGARSSTVLLHSTPSIYRVCISSGEVRTVAIVRREATFKQHVYIAIGLDGLGCHVRTTEGRYVFAHKKVHTPPACEWLEIDSLVPHPPTVTEAELLYHGAGRTSPRVLDTMPSSSSSRLMVCTIANISFEPAYQY